MHFGSLIWVFLQVLTALGAALLSFCVMSARTEAALAKEREALAEYRAALRTAEATLTERTRAVEQEVKRRSLDEFLQDLRVDERRCVRDKGPRRTGKKTLVLEERLFFRNIPLSNWVEQEIVIENGCDPQSLSPDACVFCGGARATERPKLQSAPLPACRRALTLGGNRSSSASMDPLPDERPRMPRVQARGAKKSAKCLRGPILLTV